MSALLLQANTSFGELVEFRFGQRDRAVGLAASELALELLQSLLPKDLQSDAAPGDDWAGQIEEVESGERYVVDSWFQPYGYNPYVQKAEQWGDIPFFFSSSYLDNSPD